tara:strand:- start:2157 stop:3515 length:1359 start_codon:yes stop_codon:yes gene_type:complete
MMEINVGDIITSTKNYRTKFNDESIDELAKSIEREGLLQPVLIRKVNDNYELVAGERRLKAVKKLGWKTITAIEKNIPDDDIVQVQIIENSQRVNPTPIEEYKAFDELVRSGKTVSDIADEIGKSITYVNSRLQIKKLSDRSKELLDDDVINLSHVKLLSCLQETDQDKALNSIVKNNGILKYSMNAVQLKRFIEKNIEVDLTKAIFSLKDKKLHGGSCLKCTKRTGFNKQLFEDFQKEETCLDPQCFIAKKEEFLINKKNALQEKHSSVIELNSWSHEGEGDGRLSLMRVLTSEEPTETIGLIVNGDLAGNTVYIVEEDSTENDIEADEEIDEVVELCSDLALDLIEKDIPSDNIEFSKLILWQLYSSMDNISQRKLSELFNWKLKKSNIDQKFDYTNTREFFIENTKRLKEDKIRLLQQIVSIFLFSNNSNLRIETAYTLIESVKGTTGK